MTNYFEPLRSGKGRGLAAVLLVLFVGRLAFSALVFARPELAIANDTDRYVPIANAILSGQALVPDPARTGLLLNTIGYPLFLAGVYGLLGHAPGDVALAQLIISGLLALTMYIVLARPIGVQPAFVGALILLVDPLTILWSMTVLTETLLAAVLGIAALTLIVWASSGRTATLLLAGIFLGLACLVKPYILLIAGIWAIALLFYRRGSLEPWRRTLAKAAQRAFLFGAPILLLVLPWVIRNAVIWDCPTLSSVDRVTMRDYVGAKILAEAEHISLDQAQSQLRAKDPGVCPVRSADYLNLVLAHPAVYAKLHIAGTIPVLIGTNFDRWFQFFGVQYTLPDLWGPVIDGGPLKLLPVLTEEWVRFPQGLTTMALMTLLQVVVYGLACLGLLAFSHTKDAGIRWNIIVLGLAVLVLIAIPGQGGNERFRVPVQPLLAILAAYGTAWKLLSSGNGFAAARSTTSRLI